MTYALIFRHNRLELDFPSLGNPLWVDFEPFHHPSKTLLAKAIGIKKNNRPAVCDVTAGLGKDAYSLYLLGCRVSLVERSPVIGALLADGLKRAGCTMDLTIGEAKNYLQGLSVHPDVIYLDPIFPEKTKTALSQKSARILRALAGKNEDAEEIFTLALKTAKNRVVVKRALHSELISPIPKPDIVFKGKSIRFDVYLV